MAFIHVQRVDMKDLTRSISDLIFVFFERHFKSESELFIDGEKAKLTRAKFAFASSDHTCALSVGIAI